VWPHRAMCVATLGHPLCRGPDGRFQRYLEERDCAPTAYVEQTKLPRRRGYVGTSPHVPGSKPFSFAGNAHMSGSGQGFMGHK